MTKLRRLIPMERRGKETDKLLGALYDGYVAFHNKYYGQAA